MGIYIPQHKVQSLLKYKYSSTDLSLTSKYVLNPFWNKLVLVFPKTMAPNAITLLGLSMIFVNFLTLLYYNPTLACGSKPLHISLPGGTWDPLFRPHGTLPSKLTNLFDWARNQVWSGTVGNDCPPNWIYFTFAAGLFAYQSLDAIDGKQARRTGTSGPLGELFDHGCDALNTTLGAILAAAALNLGLSWWTVASLVATNCNFYLSTWEEWHTGTLFLSAFSGPVEGILLVVGIFTVTGFKGPQFWDTGVLTLFGLSPADFPFPVKNLPLNDLFLVFSSIGLVFNIITATKNVYASLPAAKRTPLSILKPLSRLSPWVVHTTAMLTWLLAKEPLLLRTTLFIPFAFTWGLSFAHHVQLLILAHLTKSSFPAVWKHPLLILSILGSLDANLPRLVGATSWIQSSEERTKHFVMACLAFALVVYGHFVVEVIGDICTFYDINCLTIKKKEKGSKSPADFARETLNLSDKKD
ncbi:uncharacterized protein JCM15063_000546 [Sporobolomyces koalae]|uniref:uncharacterized protein n=1 Tax=Sporobolomyces koalae TaxID=500713 RepID=UPI003175CAF3